MANRDKNTLTDRLCKIITEAIDNKNKGEAFSAEGSPFNALVYYALAAKAFNITLSILADDKKRGLACGNEEYTLDTLQKNYDTCLGYISQLQEIIKSEEGRGKDEAMDADCKQVMQYMLRDDDLRLSFRDVIGLQKAKSEITNGFLNPILYPNLFPKLSKGILLYGPPGTGKTQLARAVYRELSGTGGDCVRVFFFAPTAADFKDKYVGETEKKISKIFNCANKIASEFEEKNKGKKAVSIIFLDEVEAITPNRSKNTGDIGAGSSLNTLLQVMDGIKNLPKITVFASTNLPWELDPAFLRRFDTSIYVPLPTPDDIYRIISLQISKFIDPDTSDEYLWNTLPYKNFLNISEADLSTISTLCSQKQYSGSDVNRLMKQAIRIAGVDAIGNGSFIQLNGKVGEKFRGKYVSTLCTSLASSGQAGVSEYVSLSKGSNNLKWISRSYDWELIKLGRYVGNVLEEITYINAKSDTYSKAYSGQGYTFIPNEIISDTFVLDNKALDNTQVLLLFPFTCIQTLDSEANFDTIANETLRNMIIQPSKYVVLHNYAASQGRASNLPGVLKQIVVPGRRVTYHFAIRLTTPETSNTKTSVWDSIRRRVGFTVKERSGVFQDILEWISAQKGDEVFLLSDIELKTMRVSSYAKFIEWMKQSPKVNVKEGSVFNVARVAKELAALDPAKGVNPGLFANTDLKFTIDEANDINSIAFKLVSFKTQRVENQDCKDVLKTNESYLNWNLSIGHLQKALTLVNSTADQDSIKRLDEYAQGKK